jgi:AraC-like DNA-binding protein
MIRGRPGQHWRLERVESADDFAADPVGRFAAGNTFLVWCTRPDLFGVTVWGRASMAELAILSRIYDRSRHSVMATPCDLVFDARRLEGFEPGVFESVERTIAASVDNVGDRLRRQALVRGRGLLAAALCGFYTVIEADFEVRVCTELAPALAWLGEPERELCVQLEGLIADAVAGTSFVDRLRAYLAMQVDRWPAIDDAARSLAVSSRSLQRRLQEAGTCYRAEVDQARLALAKQLLLETDLKIAAIADRIGSSTEANFISFFRRLMKTSPAEWRRRTSHEGSRVRIQHDRTQAV